MKNLKYYTVRAIPKSNRKIIERDKRETPNKYTCIQELL
jgi:hypothetical protein